MMSEAGLAFSVVVPTYNRPAGLRRCVTALCRQDYGRTGYEVVVVDDGSGPIQRAQNLEIVDGAGEELNIRLVYQTNAGPAAARNRGAREARAEWLAFTDDDCAPAAGWLRTLRQASATNPGALLGGRIINGLPDDRCAAASQSVTDFAYRWARELGHGTGPGGRWLFATANLACPRDHFHDAGGFDASFPLAAGEDYDFCYRYQLRGYPAAFIPDARVEHFHAMNLRQFFRQHFAYGRGLLQFRRRVSAASGRSAPVRVGAFQLGLARHSVMNLRSRGFWQAGLVALSQAATAAGAATEALRPSSRDLAGNDHVPGGAEVQA